MKRIHSYTIQGSNSCSIQFLLKQHPQPPTVKEALVAIVLCTLAAKRGVLVIQGIHIELMPQQHDIDNTVLSAKHTQTKKN